MKPAKHFQLFKTCFDGLLNMQTDNVEKATKSSASAPAAPVNMTKNYRTTAVYKITVT